MRFMIANFVFSGMLQWSCKMLLNFAIIKTMIYSPNDNFHSSYPHSNAFLHIFIFQVVPYFSGYKTRYSSV